ncbi:hypothetical protein B0H16DRAFT_1467102 [Mycena metata]|uniref:Uncharacterized protein n=1 Tax=Mycena metata TaxID=1033252 RepID=A0AAD7I5E5_9AGAR|nr:hypothetical protein B0H16DRAFT_1467102 [Mycena metata]
MGRLGVGFLGIDFGRQRFGLQTRYTALWKGGRKPLRRIVPLHPRRGASFDTLAQDEENKDRRMAPVPVAEAVFVLNLSTHPPCLLVPASTISFAHRRVFLILHSNAASQRPPPPDHQLHPHIAGPLVVALQAVTMLRPARFSCCASEDIESTVKSTLVCPRNLQCLVCACGITGYQSILAQCPASLGSTTELLASMDRNLEPAYLNIRELLTPRGDAAPGSNTPPPCPLFSPPCIAPSYAWKDRRNILIPADDAFLLKLKHKSNSTSLRCNHTISGQIEE